MRTKVNRTDKSKSDYAYVLLYLYNDKKEVIDSINTRAGDFSAWEIAWDTQSDTLVMYSGDIGNKVFVINENHLQALNTISPRLFEQAETLIKKKRK